MPPQHTQTSIEVYLVCYSDSDRAKKKKKKACKEFGLLLLLFLVKGGVSARGGP